MTIKVYANYDIEVITEKEFLEKVEELAKEYDKDTSEFEIFLDENWELTESEKAMARKSFHEKNVERATEDVKTDWVETTLEI